MLIRDLKNTDEIIAGDKTILHELLHPDRADITLRYSLAHAVIKIGNSSIPHSLKSSEVYYIISGSGKMHIDEESSNIEAGQAVYIPPNATQYLENTGKVDIEFLAIVDPAWQPEDEIIN